MGMQFETVVIPSTLSSSFCKSLLQSPCRHFWVFWCHFALLGNAFCILSLRLIVGDPWPCLAVHELLPTGVQQWGRWRENPEAAL
ncbi:hypothetical protein Nepgr_022699 [Nepenthes gracilis]|uniref:Uncharacterized protein n=1 Tax=Nepenthes gracilis TaxID=150966 RepID=A0AAD3T1E2_NEPGR|nr:hypothetical protein Nepgr_022699 [Nepenthes gracilis]